MQDIENIIYFKKKLMLANLERAKMCAHLGKAPWTIISNNAYKSSPSTSISIIITLCNYSKCVCECLDSIYASKTQNVPEGFEIIVVDDCSVDNSSYLVQKYIDRHHIPACLVQKLFNTGVADSRNVGLHLARSSYVLILDVDNWIYPNCLSTLYNEIVSSNYASVYGIINKFDDYNKKSVGLLSYYEWDVSALIKDKYLGATAMFDRDTVIGLGGYSTELVAVSWYGWEDYDLWLKLAQADYLCKLVPQILSTSIHNDSLSNATLEHRLAIAKHFTTKFSRLLKQYSHLDQMFGFARDSFNSQNQQASENNHSTVSVEQNQAETKHLQFQLQEIQAELEQLKLEFEQKQIELEQMKVTIAAMSSSKFWKLRQQWFKLKRTLGLKVDREES
jgi:glycosyltransferase involved in cell wall biosynthesis